MAHFSESTGDQLLLMQMRATDAAVRQQGWEAWYKRDASDLQRYIYRHAYNLRCAQHSEDILQDCFVIGFKNVSSGAYREQEISLYFYLVGIARNLLRKTVRQQRREPTIFDELEVEDESLFGVAEQIDLEETVNGVREACSSLSSNYQRVVEGIYVRGKTSHEVGEEVGKSAGNVRAISFRAVREIGQYLERRRSMHLSAEAIRACLEVI
jgi:RNA polymerase sigma factor (sigma-70 family)